MVTSFCLHRRNIGSDQDEMTRKIIKSRLTVFVKEKILKNNYAYFKK